MEFPISRIYNCYLENPENPVSAACKAAVAVGGTQPLYDWNGVRQGNAAGHHRALIPNGTLCGGGDPFFRGVDLPRNDWPTTPIAPDSNGNLEFVFRATAPHETLYMGFYVTKNGYDPTKPLAWSDLERRPFCRETNPVLANGRYTITCPFPKGKSGKHLIYNIWQRSNSPEAFYTCMDVRFVGDPPPAAPRELGQIRARQDLPAGSEVTLRLFEVDPGSGELHDLNSYRVTVGAGNGSAEQWPYHLARAVNQDSRVVQIGVLQADGTLQPTAEAHGNSVYSILDLDLAFEVEIRFPQN